MKNWTQYTCWHGFTGVVEPAFWRHTSVYILEDNRTNEFVDSDFWRHSSVCREQDNIYTDAREQYNMYTDAWKQKTLCVEDNTIFT